MRTATTATACASWASVLRLWPVSSSSGSGAELGRHVDDVLAVGEQPLRQRAAGAVAALDRPDPLPVGRDVFAHRRVAGLVGAEPAGRQDCLVVVDDLDRRRQLVGIDPDEHLRHASYPPRRWTCRDCEAGSATESWADPSGATPHGRCPTGTQTDREPHRSRWWAAAWRASRRAPGPSLAGRRSYRKCQVAAKRAALPRVRQMRPRPLREGGSDHRWQRCKYPRNRPRLDENRLAKKRHDEYAL